MALSGSYDYNLNALEVITYALKDILNVVPLTQSLDADEAAAALQTLNLMMKSWQRKGPHLWQKTEGDITLVNATASYDLSGTLNPLRVLSVRYRDTASTETMLREYTREQYFDLNDKATAGTPTQYYFDPQRGAPTLYVWPVQAVITTEVLKVTYHARTDDLDALTDDINVPREELETVAYGLAARLLDGYGIEGEVATRVLKRAEALVRDALDWERENSIVFMPGYNS